MHRITCILLAASKIWASGILAQNVAPSRVQWRTSLGTAYEDRPASIYEARDGGYVVAPSSWYPTTNAYGNMDAWLFWFDEKGLLISSNSFGGTSNDRFKTITQTADGGWIAAGIT